MLAHFSTDLLLPALMSSIALRELLIILLPDSLAGPEGRLIRLPPGKTARRGRGTGHR